MSRWLAARNQREHDIAAYIARPMFMFVTRGMTNRNVASPCQQHPPPLHSQHHSVYPSINPKPLATVQKELEFYKYIFIYILTLYGDGRNTHIAPTPKHHMVESTCQLRHSSKVRHHEQERLWMGGRWRRWRGIAFGECHRWLHFARSLLRYCFMMVFRIHICEESEKMRCIVSVILFVCVLPNSLFLYLCVI